MASKTEICNLSLGHLGISDSLADVETERSTEARVCRKFYEISLKATLRDFAWPLAKRTVTLALVEEDPTNSWAYSYRYPSNCVEIRKIGSGIANDTRQSRVPYEVGQDDDGLLIYTNQSEAEIEFTKYEENPLLYPPDFILAASWRLAAYIAPSLTAGDPYKLGDRALSMYERELTMAKGNAIREEQQPEQVESEFIRGRE